MTVEMTMSAMQQELTYLGHADYAELFDEKLCIACSDCQANVQPIQCKVYPYIFVDSVGLDPNPVYREDEEFTLVLVVGFFGTGARALICLDIPLKVQWYAESIGDGPESFLGSTEIKTKNGEFVYVLKTIVPGNTLDNNYVYKVAVTVTLGGNDVDCPALVNGYAAGGFIQAYNL